MSKRLVAFCDGTWNRPDNLVDGHMCPTNVWKMYVATGERDGDGVLQRRYYHPGVGVGRRDHWTGGAFGVGLSRNVRDAYRYIVETYDEGDEIFLFGFSRGAYTARSVAGLIRNSGLLRRECVYRLDEAYRLYRDRDKKPGSDEARAFREACAVEDVTPIRCIGVWDTVGALGIPLSGLGLITHRINQRWQFHDMELSRSVRSAFQALAIDEKRQPFKPALWQQHPEAVDQQLEQVWFSGVHCDVGGGYGDSTVADIPLLWMADRAQSCGLGLSPGAFVDKPAGSVRDAFETEVPVHPNARGPLHESWTKFYRLLPPYRRPIGKDGANQSVASTAAQRSKDDPTYKSPKLRDYLAGDGPVSDVQPTLDRVLAPSQVPPQARPGEPPLTTSGSPT